MKILALDLATKTGWALLANGITSSGVVDFSNGKLKADNKHAGNPFKRSQKWMKQIVDDTRPDVIVYEEIYRWMSSAAAYTFCGHRASMLAAAAPDVLHGLRGIPCVGYSPPTIKKHFTGKGNANKSGMVAEAWAKWPTLAIIDDNQVDALAILSLHCANNNLPDIQPE